MRIFTAGTEGHLRVLTGIALSITVVAVIFLLEVAWSGLVFALVIGWVAWEWSSLLTARRVMVPVIGLLLLFLWAFRFSGGISVPDLAGVFQFLLYAAIFWWGGMFILVSSYRIAWRDAVWLRWYFHTGTFMVLPGAWVAITGLSAANLLYLLFLISMTDIAAYYTGRCWGKRKLIPELSPGKSIEGLCGALICAVLIASVTGFSIRDAWIDRFDFIFFSLLTVLAGVIGDLGVSMLKRTARQKDSGNLLPGHGGILDRADSTLAAAPVFFIALPL